MNTVYKKPVICSDYINIYSPEADIYNGPDTNSFKHGQKYDTWIPNDFTVTRQNDTWHIFGITHPKPPRFVDGFESANYDVHEAEYQLFHCSASGATFNDVMHKGSFKDNEKILYPAQRPHERPEIWAPHIERSDTGYMMIYSPHIMRYAVSSDLHNWESGHVLFECDTADARDPYLFHDDDGSKYLIYCQGNKILYRKTSDMISWSESKVLQTNPFKSGYSESPFMIKRDGVYYLMWCLYDGKNGVYDNRTFIFAADSIDGFEGLAPLTMLEAHAPEFVTDGDNTYILSVFHPNNGINAAMIRWK